MRRLCFLLLVACDTAPAPLPGAFDMSGETLLTIGGTAISKAYIEAMEAQMPPEQVAQMKAAGGQKDFAEQMALGQVLWDKAIAEGVHTDPELKVKLDLAQRDVVVRGLIDRVAKKATSEEALQKAYDARAAEFKQPQAKARLLMIGDEAKATEVIGLLKAGADFDAIAAANSPDPAKAQAETAESDWFTKGQLNPDIDGAMFAPGAADILGPVPGPGGSFVIKVTARREGVPLDDVREELKAGVEQEAVRAFITEIQTAAPVEWKGAPPGGAPALPGLTAPPMAAPPGAP
jgi:parvulin-like peptidyl-prolyl isomerase